MSKSIWLMRTLIGLKKQKLKILVSLGHRRAVPGLSGAGHGSSSLATARQGQVECDDPHPAPQAPGQVRRLFQLLKSFSNAIFSKFLSIPKMFYDFKIHPIHINLKNKANLCEFKSKSLVQTFSPKSIMLNKFKHHAFDLRIIKTSPTLEQFTKEELGILP